MIVKLQPQGQTKEELVNTTQRWNNHPKSENSGWKENVAARTVALAGVFIFVAYLSSNPLSCNGAWNF